MHFRIKRVDIADEIVREQVYTLMCESFKAHEWIGNAVPRHRTGYWWIAFDEHGAPAGFAGLKPSVRYPDTGYLCAAGVLSPYRGRGLQKRLIRSRIRFARDLGWHTVVSDTMHHNAPSMRALIACGFRPFVPAVPWGDDDHAVYWSRSTTRKVA